MGTTLKTKRSHFSGLEKQANRNLMKFNKVLHLGRNKAIHQYRLVANQLERSLAEKALEVLVDTK
ncbi:hypothetical protein QYF61_012783 [Mycteria americana]|uniref:Uncharacterized protein n=1 Tax=Mycteria americana TaxID=33587 RepID=A0AAN7NJY3_MYCAM|nr:hypothetical protein QYF61_012783 [Mycteria americana]